MRKLPFCQQCVFFGGAGVCNEGEKPLTVTHIQEGFWCIKGIMKDCGSCKHCGINQYGRCDYCKANRNDFGVYTEWERK